jgi:hypothetical protein
VALLLVTYVGRPRCSRSAACCSEGSSPALGPSAPSAPASPTAAWAQAYVSHLETSGLVHCMPEMQPRAVAHCSGRPCQPCRHRSTSTARL